MIEDGMKERVYKYCNDKIKNKIEFSMWDVHNDHDLTWIETAILYGSWLADTSDFEAKEFSQQEWN